MSGANQIRKENIDDLERARLLRQEADMLERKEQVRGRLRQLIEISKDPYYDQYLVQMMKDLDRGRATPEQVGREAERSYAQYRQRMAAKSRQAQSQVQLQQQVQAQSQQASQAQAQSQQSPQAQIQQQSQEDEKTPQQYPKSAVELQKKNGVEFKVGSHVFSLIGAVFVLIAFVIFSNQFMSGFWQGICLYLAAAVLVLLSELLLNRKLPKFSHVVTGIGIGGLYAANMANYLVLHVVNGVVAMAIVIVTALVTLALSQRKDSTVIRIIGLLGCYISFFPIEGFGTELNFLITGFMILVINLISAVLQNQRNQELLNILHIAANLIFTILLLFVAARENLQLVYRILYVVMSFVFVELLCLRQYKKGQNRLVLTTYVANGIHIVLLYWLTVLLFPYKMSDAEQLFLRLVAEVLIALISIGVFILWEKEDGRRFAQFYYIVLTAVLLSSASSYHLEIILTVLGCFLFVRLFSQNKELIVLECMLGIWMAGAGIWFADYWYCWLFPGALLLGLLFVKQKPLFHEILVTLALVFTWEIYAHFTLPDIPLWKENQVLSQVADHISFPVRIAGLLLLFLLVNHWKRLQQINQRSYNLFQIIVAGVSYSCFWLSGLFKKLIFSSHMEWGSGGGWAVTIADAVILVLGVCYILIVLRKRYGLEIAWKHWVVTGFLIISILAGHYGMPVVTSIMLMTVALGCVGFGFRLRDKSERICGLILAGIVCLKLVLYDFKEVDDIYRVVVFLVVGVLALVISLLYIRLEKSIDKQKIKQEQGEKTEDQEEVEEQRQEEQKEEQEGQKQEEQQEEVQGEQEQEKTEEQEG